MKNRKIFNQDLNIFIFLLLTFLLYRGPTDPYFNNAGNKNTKNRKEGAAIEKDPRQRKVAKPLDLNILVTFLIFHLLVFLLFARREARKEWDLIQVDYPEKFRNDWRHDMEQQLCVSQRVIFATIKPANALLDGKCAR